MQLFHYRLPFKKPFNTSNGSFTFREGLIIKEDYLSFSCYGDIAPLPGFSTESLGQVIEQFQQYHNVIEHYFMQVNGYDTWQSFADSLKLYPSLRFGLDTFVYDRLSKTRMIPLNKHLLSSSAQRIKVNYTLGLNDFKTNKNAIDEAWEKGYRTFKLKIGHNFELELSLVEYIQSKYKDSKIRLDANQAWNADAAISYLNQLSPSNIEYCEQPVQSSDLESLCKIRKKSTIPIAADESICNVEQAKVIIENHYVDVIILKPMFLGSYSDIANIARISKKNGMDVVITSTLESGIGRMATSHLASCFGSLNIAQGLGTGTLFDNDILNDASCIQDGYYTLPDERGIGIEPFFESQEIVEISII